MDQMQTNTVVAVRVRPGNGTSLTPLLCIDEDGKVILAGSQGFEFDHVLHQPSSQVEAFHVVKPVVDKVWEGYDATILAYGQTGTGKTYTMLGERNYSQETEGIIPRAVKTIFSHESNANQLIDVSFIEIYNENIYDLLSSIPEKLQFKGNKVHGLTRVQVHSESEALCKLQEGILARHYCATRVNINSSRSHAVFSIHVSQTLSDSNHSQSTLHLVDLAGSESIKKTGNEGVARIEGININKGLLALGNCIGALGRNFKSCHVPFRDSTLTKVLQQSFNRTGFVTVIGCVSPSETDIAETVNTLRFLQRAKRIRNQPKIQRLLAQHAHELKQFDEALKSIPPTPAYWKYHNFSSSSLLETSSASVRKPLSDVNNIMPTPSTERLMSKYINVSARRPTDLNSSPTMSLPDLDMECRSCVSSILTDECEISQVMNSLINEKMVALREKTKEMVEQTFERMIQTKIPLISSQLHCLTPSLSIPQKTDGLTRNKKNLESSINTIILESPTPCTTKRSEDILRDKGNTSCFSENSPSNAARPHANDTLIPQPSPGNFKPSIIHDKTTNIEIVDSSETQPIYSHLTDINVVNMNKSNDDVTNAVREYSQSARKPRRSMRIEELTSRTKQTLLCPTDSPARQSNNKPMRKRMSLCDENSSLLYSLANCKQKRLSNLSLRSKSQSSVAANTTIDISPGMMTAMKRFMPLLQSHSKNITSSRRSLRKLKPNETPGKARKPLAVLCNSNTPVGSRAQEKHNRLILGVLNEESMRGLQKLPTVGPKTAFIIYNYRKLHGKFKSIKNLERLEGLPASFLKRFMKGNDINF